MCNQCLKSSLGSSEDFGENELLKNVKSLPINILDSFLPLRRQLTSWLLHPHLSTVGQLLWKSLTESERKCWRLLKRSDALRALLAFLLIFYVGLPLAFYLCPWTRRSAVYMNFIDWPFQTLSHPEYYGLNNTRHFFVKTTPGIILGVWHVPPSSYCHSRSTLSADDLPVVLYLHGSAESRSASYRRSMYKVLSEGPLQAHVITFDYRGFGDSTYISPTAQTLEEDATAMYHWLLKRVSASRIIVWGHSMGSGIAVRLGQALAKDNTNSPFAIVLEAPFTSIADATRTFPLSFFHRRLPLFEMFCSERTRHPDTNLNSDERVGDITAPILILHAADDSMVWSEQGKRLWEKAIEARSPHLHKPVFVELDGRFGCGHRNIHKAPNLPSEIMSFMRSVKQHNETVRRNR
ncbi:lysophosphatidylserine lipase ABHD12-like [Argiope bruennichi]|uniref:lysophosphatidylserine lipase ABHD12-like n=1 Tax=Argiope bruennichi TaxID=94029 RepID=UPI002493E5FD|nr:lysophosphatidylserine lipase ABHD12-like [Argiope bruennichi]